jgi:hypothetical protein
MNEGTAIHFNFFIVMNFFVFVSGSMLPSSPPPARVAPAVPLSGPSMEPLTVEVADAIYVLPHRKLLESADEHSFDVEFAWSKKEDEVVRAHQFVLASRCPVLLEERCFKAASPLGRVRRFKAKGKEECCFTPSSLTGLLHFVYCGSLQSFVTASALKELSVLCDSQHALLGSHVPLLQIEVELSLRKLLTVQSCSLCCFAVLIFVLMSCCFRFIRHALNCSCFCNDGWARLCRATLAGGSKFCV